MKGPARAGRRVKGNENEYEVENHSTTGKLSLALYSEPPNTHAMPLPSHNYTVDFTRGRSPGFQALNPGLVTEVKMLVQ